MKVDVRGIVADIRFIEIVATSSVGITPSSRHPIVIAMHCVTKVIEIVRFHVLPLRKVAWVAIVLIEKVADAGRTPLYLRILATICQ